MRVGRASSRPVLSAVTRVGVCGLAVVCVSAWSNGATPLSKARYDRQMTAIGKSFGLDLAALSSATTARLAEAALAKFRNQLAASNKTLAAMTPPSKVKADHARLVTAIGELEHEIGALIARVRRAGVAALDSFDSMKGLKDIQDAVRAINKAGYSISG